MNAELIEQYRRLRERKPDYGSGATHVERIAGLIECHGVRSVLDFGCGKGELVAQLRARFPELVVDGYDPAMVGKDVMVRERYDLVIAKDVLEHLDPADYEEELAVIRGLEPRVVFFNIFCRAAVNVLPNGANCHTMVRAWEWWRGVLMEEFEGYTEQDSEWDPRSKAWRFVMVRRLDLEGKRVAMVGNGPSALDSGEDIDGFDVVVRFNEFQIGPGYEAVGRRTDVLALPACNTAVITAKLKRFTKTTPYVLDLATSATEVAEANHPRLKQLLPNAAMADGRWVTGPLCRDLCAGIPGASPTGRGRLIPSTGISAIAWALSCGAREIYLTGFSFEAAPVAHYFQPGHAMSACHDLLRELRWLAERPDDAGLCFDRHIEKRVEMWRAVRWLAESDEHAYRLLSNP